MGDVVAAAVAVDGAGVALRAYVGEASRQEEVENEGA